MIQSTLPEILDASWQMFMNGASEKKDSFRLATIATIANDTPYLRTVVLRYTNPSRRHLLFYTDFRSEKIQQLKNSPTLNWLFYHPEKNIQIRAIGKATIHHQNELTKAKWQLLPAYGRKTYGTEHAPSTLLSHPSDDLPDCWKTNPIDLEQTEYAYANFAIVVCEINHLEWLHLQRTGHKRAKFDFINNAWEGQWIVP